MAKVSRRTAEDLTGRRFGRLTVIRQLENRNNRTRWLCRCDCGNEKDVAARDLKAGKVKSCGCLRREGNRKKMDISGQRFGRLTALYPTDRRDSHGVVYWVCRCDCGNQTEVPASNLVNGTCKSCGCLKKRIRTRSRTVSII